MTLVSVLMPMRNAGPFVRAALESVLAQDGADLEVVVIDDGSTDGSAAAVRGLGDPRVRLLPGPCRGIAAAFNAALAEARGDLVVRCDADDLYPPGRLAWQVRWLAEHPEFGAVCGRFTTMTPQGEVVSELACGGEVAEEVTGELRAGATRTSLCTFAVRTPLLRQIGGCRPYFTTAEDIDLLLRLGEVARVWFEPRSWYFYRLHDASATHRQGNTLMEFYEQTARAFAAQRRAGRPDDLERGCPPAVPAGGAGGRYGSGKHLQGMLLARAWAEHAGGRRLRALRTGLRACLAWPWSLGAWKSLAALAYKRQRTDQH
jgi:glycosyltransferase involved in cell wall biosynthesis